MISRLKRMLAQFVRIWRSCGAVVAQFIKLRQSSINVATCPFYIGNVNFSH
jgi:hypothetical protein